MSFAKKAFIRASYFGVWLRDFKIYSEKVANETPEYSEYVRGKRHSNHLPDPWDDYFIRFQKSWKVKRRTQYRPEGRNAYQITTNCDIGSYVESKYGMDSEYYYKLRGIIINEERNRGGEIVCYKVYGDQKEGFRYLAQRICDRCGCQMEYRKLNSDETLNNRF